MFFAPLGASGFAGAYERGILVAIGFVVLAIAIAVVELRFADRADAAPEPRELQENRC